MFVPLVKIGFSSVLLLSIIVILKSVQGGIVRRFNYDARVYEHFAYDSRYFQYSRTDPSEWQNLTAMGEARNFSFISMICTSGPGAWLLYPDPLYQMGYSQRFYLVIGEHCIRSDDIESVQPIGKMDELLEQGVVLFEENGFGSPSTLITEGEGGGNAKSLMFTGPTPFLVAGGSEKICITPGVTEDDYGYCLMPDLKASFKIEGAVTVKEGCSNDTDTDEKAIVVHNCYMTGVHEMYLDVDLTIDKLTEICAGGGDDFVKSKFTIVTELWGKRMGSEEKKLPRDFRQEDQEKLNLVWSVLDIFKNSCPAVDDLYIYMLGHLFAGHLKKYWTGGNETILDPETWKFATDFITFCSDQETNIPVYPENCKTDDQFGRMATSESGMTDDWFEIVNGAAFDAVIEQMWLIFNFVVPTCSQAAGYVTNDWSDLVLFFHQAFLDPLQDIWAEPEDWIKIYTAVFHGYDMREEHKNIVDCLGETLQDSPDFDPIGRPKKFRDYVYYKYSIPAPGEIKNPDSTITKPKPTEKPVTSKPEVTIGPKKSKRHSVKEPVENKSNEMETK